MSETRPTCTPRSLTFALVSITSPARSDVNVTGTVDFSEPVNSAYVTKIAIANNTTKIRVHQPGLRPSSSTAQPARLKLPDCPYTASEIITSTNADRINEVRTARPTASPTPAGPPRALKP